MIHLEPITEDNWREALSVSEEQKRYVADSMVLLARAYAYRDNRSCACMICRDETPVGMALYYGCPERNAYIFSQLFIDSRYQRHGYGRAAAELILERMRTQRTFPKVALCYVAGNVEAKSLYTGLGFSHTGEIDEDEIVMELNL